MLESEGWCAFYLGDNCVSTASSNVYRLHLHLRGPHRYIIIFFVRQKQKEDTNYSFLLMQLYNTLSMALSVKYNHVIRI
jgi:hypothetical protein